MYGSLPSIYRSLLYMKSGEARETKLAAAEVQIQMVSLIYTQVSFVYVLGVFCSCRPLLSINVVFCCLYVGFFYM